MKVGTDGVLLGCWAGGTRKFNRILDVGTGTGILSLLAAQRMPAARITALEIDPEAALQAGKNVSSSLWEERIEVLEGDFRTFNGPGGFDLILSNPPYFQNALLSPDAKRNLARHTPSLSCNELICKAASLLSENGVLSLILPAEYAAEARSIAFTHKLYTCRQAEIKSKKGGPAKRVMMEFSTSLQVCRTEKLTIYSENGEYSEDFRRLTQDAYPEDHKAGF